MYPYAERAPGVRRAAALVGALLISAAGLIPATGVIPGLARPASADRGGPVTVTAEPGEIEVLAAECGTRWIDVAIANLSGEAVYVDVFITPEYPVWTSRELVSTYVPPEGEVVAPVQVGASVGAGPGTHDVEFRVGRYGRVQDEVEVTVVPPPTGPGANLALGGPVTASSTHGNFSECGAVDGNASNEDWSVSTGWNDGTREVFPDWLAVQFGEPEQVGRTVLYTRNTALRSLRDWDVQVLTDGGEWLTVASVRGNTAEVVTSTFEPVRTTSVRVLALASNDGRYSRIVEFEVYAG